MSKKKNSTLGILALVFSILGCTFWLGLILAIIDLCRRDDRKKGCSIAALIIAGLYFLIGIFAVLGSGNDKPKAVNTARDNYQTAQESSNIDNTPGQPAEEAGPSAEQQKQNEPPQPSVSEKDIFGIMETAEMNDVQVTMTNYSESTGSEWNKPADGNVFVLVEFEIVNNSDSELSISSMLSFEAYADDYAANLSLGALMENDQNQLDGTVAPGKRMKGWTGYEVPSEWNNLEIHFTSDVWSNNKFKFLISK